MLNNFLKKMSLYGVILTTIMIIIWFMVFIIKQTMKYTIFGEFTTEFFAVSIVSLIGIIIALAIINISANLNIISERYQNDEKFKKYNFIKYFLITIASFAALFIIIGIVLHNINSFNSIKTANNIKNELNEVVMSNENIINELITLIDNEQDFHEITKLMSLIESSSPTIRNIEILYPKTVNGKNVLLVISRWDKNIYKKYSNLSDVIFITKNKKEIEYLNEYLKNGQALSESFFIHRPDIIFYKPVYKDNKLKFILYSDYQEIEGYFLKKH